MGKERIMAESTQGVKETQVTTSSEGGQVDIKGKFPIQSQGNANESYDENRAKLEAQLRAQQATATQEMVVDALQIIGFDAESIKQLRQIEGQMTTYDRMAAFFRTPEGRLFLEKKLRTQLGRKPTEDEIKFQAQSDLEYFKSKNDRLMTQRNRLANQGMSSRPQT